MWLEVSSYPESLTQEVTTQYKDKIALIIGIDPFGKVAAANQTAKSQGGCL